RTAGGQRPSRHPRPEAAAVLHRSRREHRSLPGGRCLMEDRTARRPAGGNVAAAEPKGGAALPAPRAILFDWDNTLVDTWGVLHRALAATFEAFGRRPWTLEETKRNVRASARDAFPEL